MIKKGSYVITHFSFWLESHFFLWLSKQTFSFCSSTSTTVYCHDFLSLYIIRCFMRILSAKPKKASPNDGAHILNRATTNISSSKALVVGTKSKEKRKRIIYSVGIDQTYWSMTTHVTRKVWIASVETWMLCTEDYAIHQTWLIENW